MKRSFACAALVTVVLVSTQYARMGPQEIKSQIDVKIIEPSQDDSEVGKEITVKGTASIPAGSHLWVLVHRIKGFENVWWPQNEVSIAPRTGKWNIHVFLGNDQDVGHDFEIAAITVEEKEHLKLQEYRKEAIRKNDWPAIKMPPITSPAVYRRVKRAAS